MNNYLMHNYDSIIQYSFDVFKAKNSDYGPTWLLFRLQSLNDEIWRKAKRIRTIEENNGKKTINEDIDIEYVGIINYCIMFLIRIKNLININVKENATIDFETIDEIEDNKLFDAYMTIAKQVRELLSKKNHDYGDAWRSMAITSMTDQIIIRVYRIRMILKNDGNCKVSEGISAQLNDIINYCIFALIKLNTKLINL